MCAGLAYNPRYGLLPSEQHGSQNSTVVKSLVCCLVCGLIHYAADVTVWKSSLVGVEYSLAGVLVGKVPPTE